MPTGRLDCRLLESLIEKQNKINSMFDFKVMVFVKQTNQAISTTSNF